LKSRETLVVFQYIIQSEKELKLNLNGYLEVDSPNENIYKVEGNVYINYQEPACFDINNILLRGGTLKNTEYIYGIVIYTGVETKIMKNIK